jgi:post-segregation antitoxin (ccd killing protein)
MHGAFVTAVEPVGTVVDGTGARRGNHERDPKADVGGLGQDRWLTPSTMAGGSSVHRRILRRMPRLRVYLPDDLYRAVKERGLPASELLQRAVRAELRRQELLHETERYLAELTDEVGEPSAAAVARAESLSRRIRGTQAQNPKAG